MKQTSLQDVPAGAVLAEAAHNCNGDVLLQAGAILNERHIRLLQLWGIAAVGIQVPDAPPAPEYDSAAQEELLDRAEAEVKACFGDSLNNEVMAEVLRLAVLHRAKELAGKA